MTRLSLASIATEELARIGLTPEGLAGDRARRTEFDPAVPGFGLRRFTSGRASYIVQRRMGGRMRTVTLGSAAVLSHATARDVARRILLRAQVGENPAAERARVRAAPAWPDFIAEYWTRVAPSWKPLTRTTHDKYRRLHLDRAFAGRFIDQIDEPEVTRWFAATTARGGPGGANRTIEILSAMLRRAEAWGYRPANSNPCPAVRRNRRRRCERYLSDNELARLGAALDAARVAEPLRVAAVRLILLTGCRKSEIIGLRWDEIRGRRIVLEDSKTGPRLVWLGAAARRVLDGLPHRRGAEYVFPSDESRRDHWLDSFWRRVRAEARLADVRLHDLRHSFASKAARTHENLPTIGKLLGHVSVVTTARYAHLDDASLVGANERIGALITAAMQYPLGSTAETGAVSADPLPTAG